MEDPDIIFVGYGSSNSSTKENRRHSNSHQTSFTRRRASSAHDFGNYPGTTGNQPNVGLYDNVLPVDYFRQPPSDFLAQYNNIFGRVGEKVSSSNVDGPNETHASSPETKKARTQPQVERKRKIRKVEDAVQQPKDKGESSYQCLLDLQECDLVHNTEVATCPVCVTEVPPGEGVVLKNCLHTFCRECLEFEVQLSHSIEVRCPFVSEEYSCESHLQDREVKRLVSPQDYERPLDRSLSQTQSQATNYEVTFHCARPGCWGLCLLENGTDGACSVCLSRNCVSCRTIHDTMGCPRKKDIVFVREVSNKLEKQPREEQRSDVYRSVEKRTNTGPVTDTDNLPADYRNLLEVTEKGLVANTERFDCPICFSEIEIGDGVTLKDCLHNYCKECLKGTILHSETVVVKCPFVNDEYACESFVQEREIKWLLTFEEFERHLTRGLAQAERQSANSFHCKTPDCVGWCLVEDEDNATQFVCQVCQHSNCLSCAAIHEGKNCKQYQDMAALESDTSAEAKKTRQYLEKQLKNNKAVPCPKCQVIIVKRGGCDIMTCAMCHEMFYWSTKKSLLDHSYLRRLSTPAGNFPLARPSYLGRPLSTPAGNFPLAPPSYLGRPLSTPVGNFPLAPPSYLGRHLSTPVGNFPLAPPLPFTPSYLPGRRFRGWRNPVADARMETEDRFGNTLWW